VSCEHPVFEAQVDVTRVLHDGELVSFAADVRVRCVACGEPFGWRGVECGASVNGPPMRSADGLQLRAWLLSPSEMKLLNGPAGLVGP
jgi:hypothetical protein